MSVLRGVVTSLDWTYGLYYTSLLSHTEGSNQIFWVTTKMEWESIVSEILSDNVTFFLWVHRVTLPGVLLFDSRSQLTGSVLIRSNHRLEERGQFGSLLTLGSTVEVTLGYSRRFDLSESVRWGLKT